MNNEKHLVLNMLSSMIDKRKKYIRTAQEQYEHYRSKIACLHEHIADERLLSIMKEHMVYEMRQAKACWQELNQMQQDDVKVKRYLEENKLAIPVKNCDNDVVGERESSSD